MIQTAKRETQKSSHKRLSNKFKKEKKKTKINRIFNSNKKLKPFAFLLIFNTYLK